MDHNPITMGDLAYSQAGTNEANIRQLRKRVQRLENTVSDLLTTLADAGIVQVVDPDVPRPS